MIKDIITKTIFFIFLLFFLFYNVQAADVNTSSDGFNSYINELKTFTAGSEIDVDLTKIANDLKDGKGLSYDNVFEIIASMFFKQIRIMLSSSVIIVIFVIISSIIKSLAIDKQSDVIKLTNLVCFISLSVIVITNFINMLGVFKSTFNMINDAIQIIAPFLFGLLIVNGAVTTIGIVQPLILFCSSFVSYVISSVILPIMILSISFSIIGSINNSNGISKLGAFFRKMSVWILGVLLTIFIAILSLETTITKDVDSLAVKTTTAAVSNFVPVVGKFFSDSFETVVGASKVITKTGGVIGIIVIVLIAFIPVVKLIVASLIYNILSILSEIIDADSKASRILSDFSSVYKTLCGILIASALIFVISVAIILNLASSIVR